MCITMHTPVFLHSSLGLYLLLGFIVKVCEPTLQMSTEPGTGLTGLYARMQARLDSLSEARVIAD